MNGRTLRACLAAPLVALTIGAAPPDRSAPPAAGPTPPFKSPAVKKSALPNGLVVYVAEAHDVPVVAVDLWVRSGAVTDSKERAGLASLAADMLDEGAGRRSSLEIADEVDYLGASLSTAGGWETTAIHLFVPVKRLEPALAIMADVALRPTFPETELERLRKERLTMLLQWRDDARSLSSVAFRQRVYGTDNRFGIPAPGTEESIRALTRDDLIRFHKEHFVASNAAIVVVGDVDAAAVLKMIEGAFGDWDRGRAPEGVNAPEAAHGATSVTIVDREGAAQTEIRIGAVGPTRGTPDYFALTVLNTVLGGSFTSRLQQNLREEHGYAYGAASRFEMNRGSGLFFAGAGVQTAVTDSALFQFMKELRGIRGPATEEELSRAKNNIALSFPADFETSQQIAGRIAEIYLFDLPEDYFARYIDEIGTVTLEDLARVANRYVDPDRMEIVLVGDRAQIQANVEKLGLGEVRTLTVEDILGKPPKV